MASLPALRLSQESLTFFWDSRSKSEEVYNLIDALIRNLQTRLLTVLENHSDLLDGPLGLKSYTVATLPVVTANPQMIYISDETGGAIPAFSDGTDWRRVTDRAVVS